MTTSRRRESARRAHNPRAGTERAFASFAGDQPRRGALPNSPLLNQAAPAARLCARLPRGRDQWAYGGAVTVRIWPTRIPSGSYQVRLDPGGDRPNDVVTVQSAGGAAPYDGVWLNGARSYDTYVLIDGQSAYHAPSQHLAERSFAIHEGNGGGHAP
jgi:hypothetical protein